MSSGHDRVPGPVRRVLNGRAAPRGPSLGGIDASRRSHYDVLGVARHASADEIRRAYRELARRLHPDRVASAPAGPSHGADMAAVNEAYRVLSDPGRRLVYDRGLDRGLDRHGAGSAAPPSAAPAGVDDDVERPSAPPRHTPLSPAGPARVPWKLMAVVAAIGSAAVLASSAFTDPPGVQAPDGILQIGSCIAFEPNGDAREVACTGTPDDVVVELMVPLDATCPAFTQPHRDRQGMVVVCVPIER